jgi:hypothetical protein
LQLRNKTGFRGELFAHFQTVSFLAAGAAGTAGAVEKNK